MLLTSFSHSYKLFTAYAPFCFANAPANNLALPAFKLSLVFRLLWINSVSFYAFRKAKILPPTLRVSIDQPSDLALYLKFVNSAGFISLSSPIPILKAFLGFLPRVSVFIATIVKQKNLN